MKGKNSVSRRFFDYINVKLFSFFFWEFSNNQEYEIIDELTS